MAREEIDLSATKSVRDFLSAQDDDAVNVVRESAQIEDEGGPLHLQLAVWTRSYGPYLRYAFAADRPAAEGSATHPFCRVETTRVADGVVIGNIVADNDVTRALLRLAILSDAELKGPSGTTSPPLYRIRLLECLAALWD